jgi:hypothetical protein
VQTDTLAPNDDPTSQEIQTLSTQRLGGIVRSGFEWLLSPNVALRLEGAARIHLPSGEYTPFSGAILRDFEDRSDSYSPVGGRLGGVAMF